jgi:hypothetical protein
MPDGWLCPCSGTSGPSQRELARRPGVPLKPDAAPEFPRFFPHPLASCHTHPTFRPDGWPGPRSPGRRKAVSSGLRGPYPRAGSLRSFAPASAGTCPIGVDGHKGLPRESRNRLRLIRVPPAASDPHGLEGRPALTRCGVTPDPGLTGPCRLGRSRPPGGWERAGSVPEGPNATRPPRACVMLCGKEGRPRARKARASLAGGARVNAPNHILPTTTGPSPVPHKSGQVPDTETAPMPPAKFSRAGFWRGMEGQGRADRSRSWHAVLPRKRGRTRSGTSCANKKPRKRLRLRGLDTWQ